ncbi:MAG: purine-nucleoside phosphorylase [Spirochaetia bacterium]
MSIHINAKEGDIAEGVLLPGDPLRAKFIAENYLENAECYNTVRNMFGFTGTYKGKRVSVQGTGMGLPSHAIYVNELIQFGAKKLIRVGSCGSLQEDVHVRDLVLGMSASNNSNMNRLRFGNVDFAPTADFDLLKKAYDFASEKKMPLHVGNIFSTDAFYDDNPDAWKLWAKFRVLAVEMETAELYTLAAKFNIQALSIVTVSDNLVTSELTTPEEREKTFTQMMEVALETITAE